MYYYTKKAPTFFGGTTPLTGEMGGGIEKKDGPRHDVLMQNRTPEPMDASQQFCPNRTCSARGKIAEGNIRIHSYQPARYRCRRCKKTFSARQGTLMEGLRTPTALVVIVITLLAYGCPTQAIVHAYGLDERTVADWHDRAGKHCQQVHEAVVLQGHLDLQHPRVAQRESQLNKRAGQLCERT
jgi:transposase-like protein